MDHLRLRNRLLVLWVVGSGLWVAAVQIFSGLTRPSPSFYVVAPALLGLPAVAFLVGWLWLRMRRRR